MPHAEPTPQSQNEKQENESPCYGIGCLYTADIISEERINEFVTIPRAGPWYETGRFAFCDRNESEVLDSNNCGFAVLPCTRDEAVAFISEDAVQIAEKMYAERQREADQGLNS